MADDSKKSTSLTDLDSTPAKRPPSWKHGGSLKNYAETVEAVDGASIGSVYRFFRIPSWARVVNLTLLNDALSAGAGDVGIYRTASDGGAVVDADLFASAVSMASANKATGGSNIAWEADGTTNSNISNITKRVWELAGLTTDPNIEYDVAVTLTTAAGAAGTISLSGTFTW